jgi:hypothetical protein
MTLLWLWHRLGLLFGYTTSSKLCLTNKAPGIGHRKEQNVVWRPVVHGKQPPVFHFKSCWWLLLAWCWTADQLAPTRHTLCPLAACSLHGPPRPQSILPTSKPVGLTQPNPSAKTVGPTQTRLPGTAGCPIVRKNTTHSPKSRKKTHSPKKIKNSSC